MRHVLVILALHLMMVHGFTAAPVMVPHPRA
jgi:hypothetical protein